LRAPQPPDDVAAPIDLDLQTAVLHPGDRELARPILFRRPPDPIGAHSVTDVENLIQPPVYSRAQHRGLAERSFSMTELAASRPRSALERWFKFDQNRTTPARDTIAGLTTFIVMSYIIFVNPSILSFRGVPNLEGKGLPFEAVLTSTCLVAGVMTILMGLYSNRAYAIAPGLGLNAVVAFTLVAEAGLSFPEAMGLIVVEGLAAVVAVLMGLRESIMRAIPLELKKAIAIGIGLFIAFIGLYNSGLVVGRASPTPVDLASFTTWPVLITLVGIVITVALRAIGFPGDLLIGIIATTVFATILNYAFDVYPKDLGYARWPDDIFKAPDFSLVGDISFDAFTTLPFVAALAFAFSLFLADFFDTMGTLVGVGRQAGYLDRRGELPEIRKPLLVDSAAAAAGGFVSASSATTYIESAAGVGVGGRTGWVSVITGALFFPFMFVAPLIGMVPPQATAPALIIVGWLMISVLTEAEEEAEAEVRGEPPPRRALAGIDFHDVALGLSAAIVIMFMPFSFSITDGIAAGFIVYVLVRTFQGLWNEVHPLMWAAALAFAIYFAIPILQQEFSWI
jgi:AGZA family xanthine/uracil permease-like MFS transporter